MAMSVVPDAAVPFRETYHNDNPVAGVESCAASTSAASVALDSFNRHNQPQPQQVQRPKQPASEVKETAVEPQPSAPAKGGNVWEARPTRKDDDIPFITVNHHRILQWMEEGEQAQQGPTKECKPHRHHSPSTRSSSRRSTASSVRQSEKSSSRHLPNQPIASDPMMPPLPAPHASSVLEETKRRLQIEVSKESERRSKHHPKQRYAKTRTTQYHIWHYHTLESEKICTHT